MPIHFQKSLQECLPKIKKPTTRIGLPPPPRNFSSSTARWILRGCKHPKTLSFACDDQKENEEKQQKEGEGAGDGVGDGDRDGDDAATLSDIDRFLMENFKSLYNKKDGDDVEKSSSSSEEEEEETGRVFMDPPQEKNIKSSHRFFVAPAAGSSSSSLLMEEARTSRLTIPCTTRSTSEDMTAAAFGYGSGFFGFDFAAAVNSGSTSTGTSNNESERTSSYSAEEVLSPEDFITVLTYSNTPYNDFKKSMQEMIEARLKHNGKIDWEFMEELLFCYLNLNDKKSYRFILRAFVDMIVFLRTQNQNQNNRLSKPTECSSMQ